MKLDPTEFQSAFNSKSGFFDAWTRSIVPADIDEISSLEHRGQFLAKLFEEVAAGRYFPSPVRATIISDKGAGIPRTITSLALRDACVYHYCTFVLSKYLPLRRASNTYAGWSIRGATRKDEYEELDTLLSHAQENDGDYIWTSQLNPMRSRRIWKEFQQAAIASASAGEFTHFVTFDINTFYNNIDLNLLERRLRGVASYDDQSVIDLLFVFLKNWNRASLRYASQAVGLPIEEVGDSSRMLANFYLQEYDQSIQDIASELPTHIRFLRYSDDQWFMTQSRRHAEYLLIQAARLLGEVGLSINAGKVQHLPSRDDFLHYWNVQIFEPLGWDDGGDPEEFVRRAALQDIHDRTGLTTKPRKRRYVVQKLLWLIGHAKLTSETRSRLIRFSIEDDTVAHLNPDQMRIILKYSSTLERLQFLEALSYRDMVGLHSEFRFRLEKFLFTLDKTSFRTSAADVELNEGIAGLPANEKQRRAQKLERTNKGKIGNRT